MNTYKSSKRRGVSLFLAVVMFVTIIPASVVSAAGYVLTVLISPSMTFERVYTSGDLRVRTGDYPSVLRDARNGEVIEEMYDWVGYYDENGLAQFRVGDWDTGMKYGLIDESGKVVVEPIYNEIRTFSDGLAWVRVGGNWSSGGTWGALDAQGKVVIPVTLEYDPYENFKDGVARVGVYDEETNSRKYGLVDKKGKVLIEPKYQEIDAFSEGLAAVSTDDGYGFIDKAGKEVVKPQYGKVTSFSGGFAAAGTYNGAWTLSWSFIDTKGNVVLAVPYDQVKQVYEGVAIVGIDDEEYGTSWGLIDMDGTELTSFDYDNISEFYADGYAIFRDSESLSLNYSVVSAKGEIIFSGYKQIYPPWSAGWSGDVGVETVFNEHGLALVKDAKDKYGLVDKNGKVVVKPEYDGINGFQGDYANVNNGSGKYGVIDKSGKVVIKLEYDTIYHLIVDGIALVSKKDKDDNWKWGAVDAKSGKVIVPVEFNTVTNTLVGYGMNDANGLIVVEKDGYYGIYDSSGNEVIPHGEYRELLNAGAKDGTSYIWAREGGEAGRSQWQNLGGEWGIIAVTAPGGKVPDGDIDLPTCPDCGEVNCVCVCDECGKYPCKCPPCGGCGEEDCNYCNPECDCGNCDICGFDPKLGGRLGFGNLTGTGAPAMADALQILRLLVKLSNVIDGTSALPKAVGDIGGTKEDIRISSKLTDPGSVGMPGMADALQVLRFIVKLPTQGTWANQYKTANPNPPTGK